MTEKASGPPNWAFLSQIESTYGVELLSACPFPLRQAAPRG